MNRPNITTEKAQEYLRFAAQKYKRRIPEMCVLAIRGYYLDSMGKAGANDRNIYDDALVVVSPSVTAAFNGNTDPSAWRPGIASLRPGIYPYRPGNHGISRPGGGYPAFRPATPGEELPVDRDGERNPRPGVAINNHKGGRNGTSSLGCQTVHPDQWDAYYALVRAEMKREGLKQFDYVLVVESEFREGHV